MRIFLKETGMPSYLLPFLAYQPCNWSGGSLHRKTSYRVPCAIKMEGMDALLSMVNMPPGVPVATMGVDSGGNAAILAAEMLGIGDKVIKKRPSTFQGQY